MKRRRVIVRRLMHRRCELENRKRRGGERALAPRGARLDGHSAKFGGMEFIGAALATFGLARTLRRA